MAKPVRDGAVCQVSILGVLHAQTVITTWHYRFLQTTPVFVEGDTVADQISTRIIAGLYGSYTAIMPVEWTATSIDIQWITPVRYRKKVYPRADAGGGGTTTTANMAAALTLQGDAATRRAQATKHIPGLGSGDILAGTLRPAYLALLNTLGGSAVADLVFALGQAEPVIYGRFIAADPTTTPPTPGQPELITTVTTYNVNPNARVQRRRTVGLGV